MEVKTTAGSNTTAAEGSDSAFSEEALSIPKRLNDRVSRMLKDIEKELDNVELSIGNRMHVLDTDRDGIITQQELEHAFRLIKEQLSEWSDWLKDLVGNIIFKLSSLVSPKLGP